MDDYSEDSLPGPRVWRCRFCNRVWATKNQTVSPGNSNWGSKKIRGLASSPKPIVEAVVSNDGSYYISQKARSAEKRWEADDRKYDAEQKKLKQSKPRSKKRCPKK